MLVISMIFKQGKINFFLVQRGEFHLKVRGELAPPYDILRQQATLLLSFKVVSAITNFQEEDITSCLDTIKRNQTSVVLACKLKWKVSSKVLKSKGPFNPSNFIQALSRVSQYIQCIQACGIHWLGLKF
jgi:hypothetical protein